MLVRGVVHHHIHQHPDVTLACLRHQPVKVRQRAVLRIDILVVRDVVAEVHLWRRIHRRQPDRIHSQLFQIVQPLGNPVQVADSVAVCVLKAAWINLVDDGILPPVSFCVDWVVMLEAGFTSSGLSSCRQRRSRQNQAQRAVHSIVLPCDSPSALRSPRSLSAARQFGNVRLKPDNRASASPCRCLTWRLPGRCAELPFIRSKSIPNCGFSRVPSI